jgi:hypothetical protein
VRRFLFLQLEPAAGATGVKDIRIREGNPSSEWDLPQHFAETLTPARRYTVFIRAAIGAPPAAMPAPGASSMHEGAKGFLDPPALAHILLVA